MKRILMSLIAGYITLAIGAVGVIKTIRPVELMGWEIKEEKSMNKQLIEIKKLKQELLHKKILLAKSLEVIAGWMESYRYLNEKFNKL